MISTSFITRASITFIILVASLTSSVNAAPMIAPTWIARQGYEPAVVSTAAAATNEKRFRYRPRFAIDSLGGRVDDPLIGRDDDDTPNGAINPKFSTAPLIPPITTDENTLGTTGTDCFGPIKTCELS